ncbi:MAG TPA: hypothetical protein VNW51_09435 [Mucilaginibacter sp.]|nr:hypothetical protein [Mucilaginibacter sp.]
MKIFHAFIALLFVAATVQAQSKNNNADAGFNQLLNKAGMTFKVPKGSIKAPVVKNKAITYQYAVKYPARNLEVRYLIMPLAGKTVKQTSIPLGKSPAPINDPFDIFSMDIATKAGGGIKDPQIQIGGFDPAQAKKEFGADKATFWMIPIKNNSFGTTYKFCNMVAMHKENGANAYVFYLGNSLLDITKAFKEIGPYNIYYNLKYKP